MKFTFRQKIFLDKLLRYNFGRISMQKPQTEIYSTVVDK
jgi:hypothetical protein